MTQLPTDTSSPPVWSAMPQSLVAEHRVPYGKVGKFIRFGPDRTGAWLAATSIDSLCEAERRNALSRFCAQRATQRSAELNGRIKR